MPALLRLRILWSVLWGRITIITIIITTTTTIIIIHTGIISIIRIISGIAISDSYSYHDYQN